MYKRTQIVGYGDVIIIIRRSEEEEHETVKEPQTFGLEINTDKTYSCNENSTKLRTDCNWRGQY